MKRIVDCMVGKRRVAIYEDLNFDPEISWGSRFELHIDGEYYAENDNIYKLLESCFLPYWLYTDYVFPEGDEE